MTRKEMISTLRDAWSRINMLANTQKTNEAVDAGYDVANRVLAVADELQRQQTTLEDEVNASRIRMAILEERMLIRDIFG